MSSPVQIEKTCDVCVGSLSGSDTFTADCSHTFHFGCINKNHFCPVCQAAFTNLPNKATNEEPPVYSDDEPLPGTDPMSLCGLQQKVTIKAVPERPSVVSSEAVPQFTVLVGLKAPSFSDDDDVDDCCNQRAPVDLVTVLDVSGSMYGSKLKLLKRAVHFVIDNLGPNDRLSIVSFDHRARRILPLRRMTDDGRLEAKRAVDSLRTEGSTDIVKGLKKGVRVLEERLHKNPVASIVFLSDGQDTENSRGGGFGKKGPPQYLKKLPASIFPNESSSSSSTTLIPVHAFGFGSDHDPYTMHAISEASGGTFSFIEAYQIVQDAFASCIGGLLSVVAQEVRLTVRSALHGVVVSSICSGGIASAIGNQGTQGVIDVGDLYADEEKEFLVNLGVPPRLEEEEEGRTSLLDITCTYRDAGSNRVVKVEGELVEVGRGSGGTKDDDTVGVSLEVDRQRNRVLVAESMARAHEMAEGEDLAGARALLAERRRELMGTASGRAGDELCLWLEREMEELEKRFGSMHLYNKAGRAFALSGMSSHARQRATTKGNQVEAGDEEVEDDESDDDMGFALGSEEDEEEEDGDGDFCYDDDDGLLFEAATCPPRTLPQEEDGDDDEDGLLFEDDDDDDLQGGKEDMGCAPPRVVLESRTGGPRLGGAFVTPNMERMVNKSRQYTKTQIMKNHDFVHFPTRVGNWEGSNFIALSMTLSGCGFDCGFDQGGASKYPSQK